MMVALERRDGISLTRARVRVNPRRQAERKAAIASPIADSVTLDIWVPGTVASRASGSAATSSSAEPLSRSRRSEEHTSELQSLMRISYAVFCLKKKKKQNIRQILTHSTQTPSVDNINIE